MRGLPGAAGGTICVTPLLLDRSGGRGQDHDVSAVSGSSHPLKQNSPYSETPLVGQMTSVLTAPVSLH